VRLVVVDLEEDALRVPIDGDIVAHDVSDRFDGSADRYKRLLLFSDFSFRIVTCEVAFVDLD
jgi:hypothetical protein